MQQVFPTLPSRRNGESFEDRYGFRSDEPCVRFKVLNKGLRISLELIASDIAVPVSEARNFSWKGISVIIIETKMTFLSLPELPNTVSIWGGGGAAQLLASLTWLQNCRVIYWGDIDTHGFHIVSRLRGGLPHLETVMMDHLTLEDCSSIVVSAREAKYEDTSMLTANEHVAYMRVKLGQLLLEQEKIPHSYAVARLVSATTIRS